MDITSTCAPRSDQINFEDVAAVPITGTVTEIRAGSAEQPVEIHLAEYPGRPFKPSKTCRRILVAAWGPDAEEYVGRRIKLYGDPTVRFGSQAVGGVRISHLSDIDKPVNVMLAVSKGKRAPFTVQPLTDPAPVDWLARAKQTTNRADALTVYRAAESAHATADVLNAIKAHGKSLPES